MSGAARTGDISSHGGLLIAITSQTQIDGRNPITVGALHLCPPPDTWHGPNIVITGSPTSMVEGKNQSRIGDVCACGAVIVSGSGTVDVG